MTARSTESIRSVLTKLVELDARHLPVVDDGQLVGIVSDRDFREVAGPLLAAEKDTGTLVEALDRPVSTLMSSDVLFAHPESDVADIVDLMIEQRVGAVPIVDANTERLVGIVSYVDILRAARDLM